MIGPMALAIHGGCGVMAENAQSPAEWEAARAALGQALRQGWIAMQRGGGAIDAVEAAIVVLEDSAHFNAGYGAAINAMGEHELDASIMEGQGLAGGAVTLTRRIRNPIKAARAVMETGDLVLLGGNAADEFAAERGLEMVAPSFFTTQRRLNALASLQARAASGTIAAASEAEKHGTVGAVARDRDGNLAAGTSTGGYNNKPAGRIGDSPILGAGTYAENGVCAVSGTGQGELFIRLAVAHDITRRMAYLNEPLQTACEHVVLTKMKAYGLGAGVVAIDAHGNVAAPFNTKGMFRGWVTLQGEIYVGTHADIHLIDRLD